MQLPVHIRFAGLAPSEAIERAIRQKVRHAERLHPSIIAWRVTVEQDHKHRHQGRPFGVRLEASLTGREVVVTRVHDEDVYVALRDAFDTLQQQLGSSPTVDRDRIDSHLDPGPARQSQADAFE